MGPNKRQSRREASVRRRKHWLPSAGGLGTRLAYARAKAAGVALDPILNKVGLTRQQVEDPASRIKVHDQIRFVDLVAEALNDDLLGFHLAQAVDLREIGLFYYVLASSQTLLEALQRAARYSTIVNEGISLRCITGNTFGTSFHYVGVSRHIDQHQIEFWMTALVRICRQLTGLHVLPSRVRLTHRRAWHEEFAAFLGDNVELGATADDIAFPNRIKHAPVVSADLHLNKLLRSYCEEALSQKRRDRGSFRSQGRKCHCPAAAARQGSSWRDCAAAWRQSKNACAATDRRRGFVFRGPGKPSIRPGQSVLGRSGAGDFADRLAARLSGRRCVFPCIQTLDRPDARPGAQRTHALN